VLRNSNVIAAAQLPPEPSPDIQEDVITGISINRYPILNKYCSWLIGRMNPYCDNIDIYALYSYIG